MSESAPTPPPRVITLKEFNKDTAGWMEVSHYTEQPLAITRMGRFVAYVEPIVDEGAFIGRAISNMVESGELSLETDGPLYTTEEVEEMLREQQTPEEPQA